VRRPSRFARSNGWAVLFTALAMARRRAAAAAADCEEEFLAMLLIRDVVVDAVERKKRGSISWLPGTTFLTLLLFLLKSHLDSQSVAWTRHRRITGTEIYSFIYLHHLLHCQTLAYNFSLTTQRSLKSLEDTNLGLGLCLFFL
jgi:hypothetical protein